jgi:hypothetical protein
MSLEAKASRHGGQVEYVGDLGVAMEEARSFHLSGFEFEYPLAQVFGIPKIKCFSLVV